PPIGRAQRPDARTPPHPARLPPSCSETRTGRGGARRRMTQSACPPEPRAAPGRRDGRPDGFRALAAGSSGAICRAPPGARPWPRARREGCHGRRILAGSRTGTAAGGPTDRDGTRRALGRRPCRAGFAIGGVRGARRQVHSYAVAVRVWLFGSVMASQTIKVLRIQARLGGGSTKRISDSSFSMLSGDFLTIFP